MTLQTTAYSPVGPLTFGAEAEARGGLYLVDQRPRPDLTCHRAARALPDRRGQRATRVG